MTRRKLYEWQELGMIIDEPMYYAVRLGFGSGEVKYEKLPILYGQTIGDALRERFGNIVTDEELKAAGVMK